MGTTIYLVRHAEAEGNLWRRAHGWYDGELTVRGREQAEALGRRVCGMRVDAIYSSDLWRTLCTAAPAARERGLEVLREPRLRELQMGEWENMPWAALRRVDPARVEKFARTPDWRAPGAESFAELYERTGEALAEITARHSGGAVMLVAHSVASHALLCRMLGGGIESCSQSFGGMSYLPNASLSAIELEGGEFRPLFLGACEHTADLPNSSARKPSGYESLPPELWFRSDETRGDVERAAEAWRESWLAVYGTDDNFSTYSAQTEYFRIHSADRDAIRFAMLGEDEAGVVVIDPTNRRAPDCAHVSLLMLNERFRGYGLASQLVGEAAAQAARLGRRGLALRVAESNPRAMALYRKNGFEETSREEGAGGMQITMRRGLRAGRGVLSGGVSSDEQGGA